MNQPGQNLGQPALDWGSYLDLLISERGSLAAVAAHLAAQRGFTESTESIERGLRRLRARTSHDGGVWGRRVLRVFGLPSSVHDRIRWMGQYHSRFSDLPTSLCLELIRPWCRPPISASTSRIWLHLGLGSIALRQRDRDTAAEHIAQAAAVGLQAPLAARIELALVRSFLVSLRDDAAGLRLLEEAEALLEGGPLSAADRACLTARLIDQQAYRLNKPRDGSPPDHRMAHALYSAIPTQNAPPFALCRRENGLGWSRLRLGDQAAAVVHARASVAHAGDSGSMRLRAMALNLLAVVLEGEAASDARRRAVGIARRLEDEALQVRLTR
ncbi:MAG: hypothetical protein P8R54_24170 [Myxococcota bacterium]|nr:hypothetical protein [Myxococcota bacterium]